MIGRPTNFQIIVERQPLLGINNSINNSAHPLNILMRQRQRETKQELQRLRDIFNIQHNERGENERGGPAAAATPRTSAPRGSGRVARR